VVECFSPGQPGGKERKGTSFVHRRKEKKEGKEKDSTALIQKSKGGKFFRFQLRGKEESDVRKKASSVYGEGGKKKKKKENYHVNDPLKEKEGGKE